MPLIFNNDAVLYVPIANPNGQFGRGNKRIFIDRKSFVFRIELLFEKKGNEKEGQIALSITINPYKICH